MGEADVLRRTHWFGPKPNVVKILTSKLFDIKILQTLFANPAPRKAFRGGGEGGYLQVHPDFPNREQLSPTLFSASNQQSRTSESGAEGEVLIAER
jgi:hypothetical protein